MAIAASGAVSFGDLRTEFVGGSSAISLGDLYRGGSNILSKAGDNPAVNLAASVPASGTIDVQDFYSTAKGFKNTISSSTTNVDADALFGDDYDVNYPKFIDINSGVTIGGSSDEALDIPSGLAGTLVINNAGNIYGFGGAAGGGAGGSAINCATANVTINNTGEIRGGGGGGGAGGAGGAGGNGTNTVINYSYSGSHTWTCGGSGCYVQTQGQYTCNGGGYALMSSSTTVCYAHQNSFGNVYHKGSFVQYSGGNYQLGTESTTNYTGGSGGAGGAGGAGQGYNQSAASGSSGSGGGSGGSYAGNGGTGGTGGSGSAWATAGGTGSTGSTGGNGNSTNGSAGSAGSAGGAAGAAVAGTSVTMNNTGTVSGTVA